MSQPSQRTVVLLNTTSATTNGTGPDIVLPAGLWGAATITLNVSSSSGTTQVMNAWIQRKLRQAGSTDTPGIDATGTGIYDDLLAYAQVTQSTTIRIANIAPLIVANGTNVVPAVDYLQQDAALTAGNARATALGGIWRIKYTVGG